MASVKRTVTPAGTRFLGAWLAAPLTDRAAITARQDAWSWMLANPRHGADMVRQLLDAELGDVLRDTARSHGIIGVPGGWQEVLLTPDSPLHSLEDRPLEAVGTEPLEHVEMDRLRSAYRAPTRAATRRLRWFTGWRRRGEQTASAGTADIA